MAVLMSRTVGVVVNLNAAFAVASVARWVVRPAFERRIVVKRADGECDGVETFCGHLRAGVHKPEGSVCKCISTRVIGSIKNGSGHGHQRNSRR